MRLSIISLLSTSLSGLVAKENLSTTHLLDSADVICSSRRRQDRRVESYSAARSVGVSHSVRINDVHHDRCRPEVAIAIHRHPLSSSHWVARSSSGSQVARRLPGRHPSVTASPLRCRTGLSRGAQRLGKTATLVPSRWSFARRHMLDTGELMWTSVKRAGTRRINSSLAPWRTCDDWG